ncbi:MAG: hypothetical protein WBA74_05910 [Cyclobacteriaceae bacterium]
MSFYACDSEKKPTRDYENIGTTKEKSDVVYDETDNYVIGQDSFMDMKLGSAIDTDSKYLKKEVKTTDEETYNGYALFDDNGKKIGFIYPRFNDDTLIERIEITSPEYRTTKGINVGSTFRELENAYPNIKTNGSAADGKTTSATGNYRFILDATFNNYEIDVSDVRPDTKIKKIIISEK